MATIGKFILDIFGKEEGSMFYEVMSALQYVITGGIVFCLALVRKMNALKSKNFIFS